MDLILLQPGSPDFFTDANNNYQNGGSLIDPAFSNGNIPIQQGQCMELISIQHEIKKQGNGPAVITEITCVKYVDASSVKMYELCLNAQSLGKGTKEPSYIYITRNSGDNTTNIMTIELLDAVITEIQFQSNPNDMPTEQFKICFTEILWSYQVQKSDATPLRSVKTGWSLTKNKTIDTFTG